jgi:hypothetical protein
MMDRVVRYVRLDAEYLVRIRPYLTDRESRVYEAVILECDGWARPTNAAVIASITRIHVDNVRKAIRALEKLCLIRSHWIGAPTSPLAQRAIEIVREYGTTIAILGALGRITPETLGRNSPETLGRNGPKTLGRNDPAHLTRSDLDPPFPPSIPSRPPTRALAAGRPKKGGSEHPQASPSIPDELVALCRKLWTTNVTKKGARRYLSQILGVGSPPPTVEEVARYLRSCAKSARVRSSRFPISTACMPEEFEEWLDGTRRLRLVPAPQPPSSEPGTSVLTAAELAERAKELCLRLGGSTSREAQPIIVNERHAATKSRRRHK